MSVRRPAVAGSFYPAEPGRLQRSVHTAFADARHPIEEVPAPKALVVPHAGFVYSGAVAASAYIRLTPVRSTITKVVLLGPSHRAYLRGLAVPRADAFDTPLGGVLIDDDLRATVAGLAGVIVDDEPHRHEHSLEVQLPFLQTVLDGFTLLPLTVGDAAPDTVADVIDAVWGGPETLIVISTDLSHFHAYDEARVLDATTAAAIVAGRGDDIGDHDACGCRPLRGMLQVVGRRGMMIEQLDLRNSGDTAGDRRRVVGYGAFAIR